MSYPNLHLLLQAANRRALWVGMARAALIGISVFLAGLLLALTFDAVFAFASWGLITVDLVLMALCLVLLGRVVGVTWQNRFNARRIARLLEHRLGMVDNSLINTIELREHERDRASRGLVREALSRGERRARDVAVEKAIESRPAKRAALWTFAVCGLLCALYLLAPSVFGRGLVRLIDPTGDHPPFTLVEFDVAVAPETIYHGAPASVTARLSGPDLPDRADIVFVMGDERRRVPMYSSGPNEYLLTLDRVEQSRDFYVDTPKGRSQTYRMSVTMIPLIESAQVTYRFPGYTDWAQDQHSLVGRDIRAVVGTEVEVEVESNLPLAHGTLELHENEQPGDVFQTVTLQADPQNPTVARGRFDLSRSGQGRLVLTGQNQAVSLDPFQTRVIALPDRKPRVEITDPEPVVVVVEDWTVPVVVQAIDDVELSRLELSLAVNGFGMSPIELADEAADRRQGLGRYEFKLKELGARPGDMITYYATAFDNHPSGEHFVDTETYLLQVISNEEYLDYARRSYRMEQLQEELTALRDELHDLGEQREQILQELEDLAQKGSHSPEDLQRMQQLQQELEEFGERTQDLSERLQERLQQPQLYDMEQPYRELLETMSGQLDQQAGAASQLQQALSSASQPDAPSADQQQSLRQAIEAFREQQQPFDRPHQQQLEENQQRAEAFQKADQIQSQAERLRSVIQQQREVADRLQPLTDTPLTPAQQQRANRLAREQEMLRQELDEVLSALEQAAAQAGELLPKTTSDATRLCQGIRGAGIMEHQDQAAMAARAGQGQGAHQAAEQAASKLESFLSQCNATQGGMASELDAGISLPKDSIQNSMNQLSQSRALTGLNAGRQGQSGRGARGSMSRFSLHGPSTPHTGQAQARAGRMTSQRSRGKQGGSDLFNESHAAESLSVDSSLRSASGAGNLRGVPVGYRDQAEAYFRRLSEESP